VQAAVERAIRTMWDRYDERLSLNDLAREAMLSRFYFARVFRDITGTSPGRFLTAIRLYQAKRLLLQTTLRVTPISYMVGYNSPGTFTSRFTRSVGVSPTRYRLMSTIEWPPAPPTGPADPAASSPSHPAGAVHGSINIPESDTLTRVYIAAFDSPIAQGLPSSVNILESTNCYHLAAIPPGQWYIKAAAVAMGDVDPRPWARRPLFVGESRPLTVKANSSFKIDIDMHEPCPTDTPILLALPELDNWNTVGVNPSVNSSGNGHVNRIPAPRRPGTIGPPQLAPSPAQFEASEKLRCPAGILDQLEKVRAF
jgi:AraC family transcriptional regulator